MMSPGLIFVQKAVLLGLFSGGLIFGGAYYWKEFFVSKWVGLDNKNSLKRYENSLKQLKTASTNSPWAYIREGLVSEGFLRLRFGGELFSGGLSFGGAYNRNFTVFQLMLTRKMVCGFVVVSAIGGKKMEQNRTLNRLASVFAFILYKRGIDDFDNVNLINPYWLAVLSHTLESFIRQR